MKPGLKIWFFILCSLSCLWSVFKSYQPQFDKYEKYIMECKNCEYTQRRLKSALISHSGTKSSIGDVRNEDDFLRVENLLINSGSLEKNYNRATKDCFYVIIDKEVTCACHASISEIEKNIDLTKNILKQHSKSRISDLLLVSFGSLILFLGLFC